MHTKRNGFIILAIAIVLVVVLFILLGNSTVQAPKQETPPLAAATNLIHYTPPATLPAQTKQGSCWTNSIAAPYRADAWRCTVGNAIQDPCFETSREGTLLCGVDPTQGKEGFQLTLTKPLPTPDVPKEQPTNWAWAVELQDGTFCTPFTGTRPFFGAGEAGYYGCNGSTPSSSIMLLGDLHNTEPLWTASKATIQENNMQWSIAASSTVPIKTVWQ